MATEEAKPGRDQAERLLLREPAVLRALADPLRIRILEETVEEPRTVKQLAQVLDVPPTRLYYHVKILQRNRLLRVHNRRMVGSIQERSYLATARNWIADPSLTAAAVKKSGVLGALADLVKAEMEVAARDDSGGPVGAPSSSLPILGLSELWLSPDDIADLQRQLEELLGPYSPLTNPDRAGRRRYHLFMAGYTMAPSGGPDAP
ncbi:MAG TPA: helix-turn-helix domain-containing protein [Acidimicrobiales bacterium]|nr:helix-turn-helix domain-containing protein [Acidimicrobiales bacterium]